MAYQSEIEKLEQRYRENPQQWFAALADSYRKAGDLELAFEVVQVGLEKRPNYVSGHIVKGRCLIDQKKDADAAAAFQRVLELDAENVIALKALSETSERAGGLDDARRWLTRLLEVDPMNEEAREALSHLPAAAKTEPAPTPTPTPINPLADVETLVETPAAETTPAERPSGKGFVIEKAEEAVVASPQQPGPAPPIELVPFDDKLGWGTGERVSREITQADIEAAEQAREPSLEPPARALAGLEGAEAPEPDEAPTGAASGDLPLIFPDEVASEAEPVVAPEPEPVVTETMAELYAKQGLLTEARDIYRQLVARHPGDGALARRLAELEAVPTAGPPRRSSGRVIAAGGPTVRDFLGEVFGGRPPAPPEPEPPSPMEVAFAEPEPGEDIPGAPTRRASDEVSLSSVFGEEPSPVNPRPSGAAATPEQGKKFSFDEFFGGAPPKAPKPRAAGAEPEKERGSDEDDFKRWLKGLKS